MNSALSQQRITALRDAAAQQVAVEVVAETGSTNADLLARLDQLSVPTLLVAEAQTAGRGRAGRTWHAAPGASLTFSLAWQFPQSLHALVGLPLAVGVAIAEVLAEFDVHVQLKWPNDVLKDGKKLAGVLVEASSAKPGQGGGTWAVLGVGLNLLVPDALEQKIGRQVADAPWLARLDRSQLMAALLNGLVSMLQQFEVDGFKAFVARWNRLHAYADLAVDLLDQGRLLQQGIARGVDPTGRLLLDTAAGQVSVVAGDVSLRIKEA